MIRLLTLTACVDIFIMCQMIVKHVELHYSAVETDISHTEMLLWQSFKTEESEYIKMSVLILLCLFPVIIVICQSPRLVIFRRM